MGDADAETPLCRFQQFLLENYPFFNKAAERWVLSPYAVVYRLPGTSSDAMLFLAHYDVVPAEKEKWTSDPSGAEEKDGFIYGRGTLDMKSILIAAMESIEVLCERGFKPKQDIWFAFGGDEERSGIIGAQNTAKWFAEKGIRFSWILDEGTMVMEDQIKGVETPLALVSIEEKGYLSLSLTVKQDPGHASRPPHVQAAAVLGKALCAIDKKPFPFHLTHTVESFFSELSPYAQGQGWAMKHARLLGNLFFKSAAASPNVASLLRTTVAMTQLAGSAADNVMPSEACAILNLRLLHPWTIEKAIAFIKDAVNDNRVKIEIYGLATAPVPASPGYAKRKGAGWDEMGQAIEKVFPGIPILPFLMTATTDSRHYQDLAGGIFRFCPQVLNPEELSRIHGHDERISIENLNRMVDFYTALFGLL
jgi:carboxypeptidase PM20D1